MIAGTLQTDPRSGGIKRNSDVNVLPIVKETWAWIREDTDPSVDWLIAGYDNNSKTDILVLDSGSGGIDACSKALPQNKAVFGGCRLKQNGRFVTFFYADDGTSTMERGRASMHKNGVINVMEGSDGEIEMKRGLIEEEAVLPLSGGGKVQTKEVKTIPPSSVATIEVSKPNASKPSASLNGIVSYEQFKDVKDTQYLPAGIDLLNREQALSDGEFHKVFGMDKASFAKLPAWKRTIMKKSNGLF